jgi:hypothetical protein
MCLPKTFHLMLLLWWNNFEFHIIWKTLWEHFLYLLLLLLVSNSSEVIMFVSCNLYCDNNVRVTKVECNTYLIFILALSCLSPHKNIDIYIYIYILIMSINYTNYILLKQSFLFKDIFSKTNSKIFLM